MGEQKRIEFKMKTRAFSKTNDKRVFLLGVIVQKYAIHPPSPRVRQTNKKENKLEMNKCYACDQVYKQTE